ncbi:UNVERIFIED_CONTAM: hypothetical protein FKN15_060644 [Acipenser sinensis]
MSRMKRELMHVGVTSRVWKATIAARTLKLFAYNQLNNGNAPEPGVVKNQFKRVNAIAQKTVSALAVAAQTIKMFVKESPSGWKIHVRS